MKRNIWRQKNVEACFYDAVNLDLSRHVKPFHILHTYMKCIYYLCICEMYPSHTEYFLMFQLYFKSEDFQRLQSCFYAYVAKVCKIEVGNRKVDLIYWGFIASAEGYAMLFKDLRTRVY